CDRPQFQLHLQRPRGRCNASWAGAWRALRARRLGAQGRRAGADHGAIDRRAQWDASVGRPVRRSLEDVFDLQDKVASSVAGVIEPPSQAPEIRRSAGRPTTDLSAYDLYLRALAEYFPITMARVSQALALLEKAIAIDRNYGRALSWAAICHYRLFNDGWV